MDITDDRLEELLTWHKEQRDYWFKRYQDAEIGMRDGYYDLFRLYNDSATAIMELIERRFDPEDC